MNKNILLLVFTALLLTPMGAFAGSLVKADLVVVYKKERKLVLFKNRRFIARYDVALGSSPEGAKHFEGDGKTPEGNYKIVSKREHPLFHKALEISYPDKKDEAYAKARGLSAGGQILIHGIKEPFKFVGSLQDWIDWTQGCIAVTNNEIDEIYDLVDVGTQVMIFAERKK